LRPSSIDDAAAGRISLEEANSHLQRQLLPARFGGFLDRRERGWNPTLRRGAPLVDLGIGLIR
jgi:hypothetical protein